MTGEGIVVEGISFLASHGATEEERRGQRRFEVDVEVATPLRHAAETDRLTDTVDYSEVCRLVVQTGTERVHYLLESLAGAILDALSERFPRAGLTVTVRKLAPPIAGTPRYSAVRLVRPAPSPRVGFAP